MGWWRGILEKLRRSCSALNLPLNFCKADVEVGRYSAGAAKTEFGGSVREGAALPAGLLGSGRGAGDRRARVWWGGEEGLSCGEQGGKSVSAGRRSRTRRKSLIAKDQL